MSRKRANSSETDLFETHTPLAPPENEPLASRMRPRTLEEFVGQSHLMGPGQLLRRTIEADRITSLVLYGPPGTGKTGLAHIIANHTRAHVERLNATASGVSELREAIRRCREYAGGRQRRTLLFIDEIHRFNKAQQDVLMPDVEQGNPILIGATTFNPFFALVPALLSRSLVCEFKPLKEEDIRQLLERALADTERGLGKHSVRADADALLHLAKVCDGDARRALNALEIAVLTTPAGKDRSVHVAVSAVEASIQKKALVYDRKGDAHYDTASAFIKSMRGSDPHAALYWMAKMIYGGEDPRFISRRIVICAAEDVGNADPRALQVATAAMQAAEFVGLPEARIPLAQAAVYVACAPKSNAAYLGIEAAMKDVESGRTKEVPKHLQDASYRSAKRLGRGESYQYAHNYKDHYVEQEYIPADASGKRMIYYKPTDQGHEKIIKQWLERLEGQRD